MRKDALLALISSASAFLVLATVAARAGAG
jgi:hypothetical protein